MINTGFFRKNHLFLIYLFDYIKENDFKINDVNINRIEFLLNDIKEKIIKLVKKQIDIVFK